MIFSVLRSSKSRLRTLLMTVALLTAMQPAHAYIYSGGDWHGMDLSLSNGDSISGNFSNIGQFYIPAGAYISGSTDNLVVHANRFLIDGSLTGIAVPGYKVELNSLTDLILNGSLTSWKSISLSANQVILNTGSSVAVIGGASGSATLQDATSGSITLKDGSDIGEDYRPPQSGVIRLIDSPAQLPVAGSTISLVPTPIPAAAWLLGSGLLSLVGIRRRRG